MCGIGAPELIIIFLVVLLVFGAKRIPEIARGLGKGIREFKTATKDITSEFNIDDTSNRIDAPRQPAQGTPAPRSDQAQQSTPEPAQQSAQQSAQSPTDPSSGQSQEQPPSSVGPGG